MSNSPNSPASGSNSLPSGEQASYQAALSTGLAALKRKDYGTAIAHLETACQTKADRSTQVKAQMGLVKAYSSSGDVKLAIALCKPLCDSTSSRVQDWATQTLTELQQRLNPASSDPVAPPPRPVERAGVEQAGADQAGVDLTGFVPLSADALPQAPSRPLANPSANTSNPSADPTGFVPLEATPATLRPNSLRPKPPVEPPQQGDRPEEPNPFAFPEEIQPEEVQSEPEHQTGAALPQTPPQAATSPPSLGQRVSPSTRAATPPTAQRLEWRQAGRAQRWGSLGPINLWQLWLLEAGTAIALFVLIVVSLRMAIASFNAFLITISRVLDFRNLLIYSDPAPLVFITLLALLGLSPWILDALLEQQNGLQPLSLARLEHHSPEASRLLKRLCNQRRLALPTLGLLPTSTPVALTYGFIPSKARIVVSQGLLQTLDEDEIAALYAHELGHIVNWDFAILSLVAVVTQIPYFLYWQLSEWGDRQSSFFLQGIVAAVSTLFYGLYRLLRWPGLWLARVRIYYSDRFSAEATGNPNGLTRSCLKLTLATAQDLQSRGQTDPLLEGFDLLAPVGYRSAFVGSAFPYSANSAEDSTSLTALLERNRHSFYQRWLAVNHPHPPLGHRLHLLSQYARHWRLDSELDWPTSKPSPFPLQSLLLQGAPYFGIPIGLAVALCLWLIGGLAGLLNWTALDWLWGDRAILMGCLLIGCSLGTLMRINPFFPDIRRDVTQINPLLPDLLADSRGLPVESQPVQMQGKLLGRRSLSNSVCQDLLLQTQTGLIKLHYASPLGAIGNLMVQPKHPRQLISTNVTVKGWFRQGVTPWIDVDTIQSHRGLVLKASHPLWATVIAVLTALWGTYLIAQG